MDRSYYDLLETSDPGSLWAAADTWEGISQRFAAHASDWSAKVQAQVLNSGWTGDAATGAENELAKWQTQLKDCQQALENVRIQLRSTADEVALLIARRQQLAVQAGADGLAIKDGDGGEPSITAFLDLAIQENPAMRDDPDTRAQLASLEPKRQALAAALQQLESDAQNLDEGAASVFAHLADVANAQLIDAATLASDTQQAQSYDSVVLDPWASEKDPAKVKAWWDSLPDATRQQLLRDHPDQLGNLDGIPAQDRDTANRIELPLLRDQMQQALKNPDPNNTWATGPKLAGLDALQQQLDQPSNPPLLLLGLGGPDGNHNAIVSYGNPDTATNVATYVPPVGGLDPQFVSGDMAYAQRLSVAAAQADPKSSTATVVWTNYNAPPRLAQTELDDGDGGSDDAPPPDLGGASLNRFLTGVQATHDGPAARVTAIGTGAGTGPIADASDGQGGLAGSATAAVDVPPQWDGTPGVNSVPGVPPGQEFHQDPNDPAYVKALANIATGHGDRNQPVAAQ
ncbi:alpha/beta hydrolase [Kitasatospora sp. NBC_01287]|uniref:alpha/beta hydrolase n=1 Tax=Kitasatospora sp. NBC_01287 TaxID=2903573 RepID=UPI00225BF806|nr:alpha/beta hydrolase [Kitasatospora sp. NBC_01287]MCX4751331.1 alpha/beta hydrolase [Kitasatospora sp. NBC_01287]